MHHLIIGASAAGIAAAQKIRQLDPEAAITCVSSELEWPYNKCLLADYVAHLKDDISFISKEVLEAKRISLQLGTTIMSIDTHNHTVHTQSGEIIRYDRLLLATGARTHVPSVSGFGDHPSILTFHTWADANRIIDRCKRSESLQVTILGAGLSGVELADALHARNHRVTLIEKYGHVLGSILSPLAAAFIQRRMREHNIALYTSTGLQECVFDPLSHELQSVRLTCGRLLPTDLLIIVVGQRQNVQLAQDARIETSDYGIMVDTYMRTSAPDVFAAGDCIQIKDQISGRVMGSCTWPDAMLQGCVAAQNMLGYSRAYQGPSLLITSSFFGLKMAATLIVPEAQVSQIPVSSGYLEIATSDEKITGYRVLDESQKKAITLKRAVLTGQSREETLKNILIENNNPQ